ncbi:MAG: hypothetical protein CO164_10490, partial [Rhodocyclales bacterium CG_4_9_14_3_um_filter_68_10]
AIRGSSDQVTLKQYFDEAWYGANGAYLIERIAFADGTALSFADVQSALFAGSDASETIIGSRAADHLTGQGGDDTLNGREGGDALEGGEGDDALTGGAGGDILDGGAGNDVLYGESGADSYVFGRGFGHDTIVEYSWLGSEEDRIELKDGVTPVDVRLERSRAVRGWTAEDDLKLTIRDTGETLIVKNYFNESNRHAVEEIVFADGTVWDAEFITNRVLQGDARDEELRGFDDRNDVIAGGAGNDRLLGLSGDDTLDGGAGDDVLEGGAGDDTYRFAAGAGQDVVIEGANAAADAVELAPGILPSDVSVRWTLQGDMAVGLPDGSRAVVRNQAKPWLAVEGFGIERLRFADGTVWERETLAARALGVSSGDDAVVGGYEDDTLEGGAGEDRFQDLGGDDTYRFGIGDGHDVIEDGSGRILFKPGIDQTGIDFSFEGDDLIATIAASGDAIRIRNWLNHSARIDRFDFDNGARLDVSDILAKAGMSEDAEILYGSPGDDVLAGTEKDSILYGREGNDALSGHAGRDELRGEDGDDVLDGGPGRDSLHGGAGRNIYVVAPGTGLDTATAASAGDGDDTVLFASGIRPEDVSIQLGDRSRDGSSGSVGYSDLVVGIGGNDALVIRNQNGDDLGHGAIRQFRFADGTEWTLADLIGRADGGKLGWQQRYSGDPTTLRGSQADDEIYDLTGHSVTVQARGNDDLIDLSAGNDIVSAGSGNDTVRSGAGDDALAGEGGEDILDGGDGDDVIAFNHGDGRDTITAGAGVDTLSFGATVPPAMLSAALDRDGRVVLLVDAGAGGAITLDGVRADNLPGDLERVQFIDADGKTRAFDLAGWLRANSAALMAATMDAPLAFDGAGFELTGSVAPAGGLEAVAYAQAGDLFAMPSLAGNTPTDGDDALYGTPNGDTLDAGAGNDIALGLAGNDTILAGDGNDLIHGGDGDDALDGGAGDDVIHGGWGADTLSGGGGRDELYGEWGGDTYEFRRGDGRAVIDDGHRLLAFSTGGGDTLPGGPRLEILDSDPNVLRFGPGIRYEDLRFAPEDGDLVVRLAGSNDRIVLRGYDATRATITRSVDAFLFDDGRQVADDSIEPDGSTQSGGGEGATLSGTPYADTLIGTDGADLLEGDGGADRLVGGAGPDTYRIQSLPWVRPTETAIVETWRAQDANRVELTGEVSVDALHLEFDGGDLLLRIVEGGNAIRFAGFDPRAPGMQAPVSEISLPWQGIDLPFEELVARGVRITGTPENDALTGTALADRIEGREADDTMSGGAGGDIYVIDSDGGADTVIDGESGDAPNVLVLPEGTTLDDVRLSYDTEGFLILNLANTGNRVRLSGFDPQNPLGPRAVERFRFGIDGDEIGYEELLARGFDIVGTEDADALKGTTLTDRVRGGDGNDLIEATPGGDWLTGEGGNDTYVVKLGDGIVTIDEAAEQDAGNVLRFGPGTDPNALRNNLRFEEDGNGGHVLLIPYGGNGDVVRLTGFDPRDVMGSRAIERFEFADGTAVDYATLVSWTFVVEGDNAGNALEGTNVGDRLYGYDGDDVMESGDGEDVLTGGQGDDLLRGVAGRDAYVVNPGDGADVIDDAPEDGVGNVLTFGEGTAREDVQVEVDGDDLLIRYGSGDDVVRVAHYAPNGPGGGTVIDTFEFADGTDVTLREFMNRAPVAAQAIADQVALEDVPLTLRLPDALFSDADAEALVERVWVGATEHAPAWLSYDAASRTFSGTPANADVCSFTVTVQGLDSFGASAAVSFLLTVENVNDAPTLEHPIADQSAHAGEPFSLGLPGDMFLDADAGDSLILAASLAGGGAFPGWLGFDPAALRLSGTPAEGDAGSIDVRLTATDGSGASAEDIFRIAIEPLPVVDRVIEGGSGNDQLYGGAGADLLIGGAGDDRLDGAAGADVLQGGTGNDSIEDLAGRSVLDGGEGDDRLTGGPDACFVAGGKGNDVIETGGGAVIAFNRGDGQDTILGSLETTTVSLGGGIGYGDLSVRKDGADLILDTGPNEGLTFKDWYTMPSRPTSLTLQMVEEAAADFAPGGWNWTRDQRLERLDFDRLAVTFDALQTRYPPLSSWSFAYALMQFHLAGSDDSALGGDLAYRYGLTGSLAGIGLAVAQETIGSPQFGITPQTLRSPESLSGAVSLG